MATIHCTAATVYGLGDSPSNNYDTNAVTAFLALIMRRLQRQPWF
jgi:hypothetical protein